MIYNTIRGATAREISLSKRGKQRLRYPAYFHFPPRRCLRAPLTNRECAIKISTETIFRRPEILRMLHRAAITFETF